MGLRRIKIEAVGILKMNKARGSETKCMLETNKIKES